MRVDFPEPLGPITATKSPARDRQVDATQGLERGAAGAIGLRDAAQLDEAFAHGWLVLAWMMAGSPSGEALAGDDGDASIGKPGRDGDRLRFASAQDPEAAGFAGFRSGSGIGGLGSPARASRRAGDEALDEGFFRRATSCAGRLGGFGVEARARRWERARHPSPRPRPPRRWPSCLAAGSGRRSRLRVPWCRLPHCR